jgi:hypothetical protein
MLSVANNSFMLNVSMLSVIMLNMFMPSVVAHFKFDKLSKLPFHAFHVEIYHESIYFERLKGFVPIKCILKNFDILMIS